MSVVSLLLCTVPLLAWLSLCANAQLTVTVYNESSNQPLSDELQYEDDTLFSNRFSNVADLRGFLHVPVPNNACSVIQQLPAHINGSWFALVSGYPDCGKDIVTNVRAAGYSLLIAYGSNDSVLSVSQDIRKTGFPVVILPEWYALRLKRNASSVVFQDPRVGLEVATSIGLSVAVVLFAFTTCIVCCSLAVFGCCFCRRRRATRRHRAEFEEYRNRQRNFEQIQRGSRNARQELIESILRQLQELEGEGRSQIPLGAAETERLPIRPYLPEECKTERCAICVEDFSPGDKLRWLPCEHCFHPECIDEWLGGHSSLCPLCKNPVRRDQRGGAEPRVVLADLDSDSDSYLLSSNSLSYGSV